MTTDQLDQETFAREWSDWHQEREKARAAPHGSLAISALHWLSDEPSRFDDAPGEWLTADEGVEVALAEGETLVIDGAPVIGVHKFGVLEDGASVKAAFDDAVVEVANRGGRDMVRPRHPNHHLLENFKGTPTFAPDRRWAVPGQFVASDSPRTVTVGTVIDGLEQHYDAPGHVEFEFDGTTYRLTAFSESESEDLLILFNDATSGVSTYGPRQLEIGAPDEEGRVLLDFNRATNQPCAYTDFSTCPLAPPENRLAIAIEAGETIPYERHRD
jgi:uncharacterized protein